MPKTIIIVHACVRAFDQVLADTRGSAVLIRQCVRFSGPDF